MKPHLRYIDGRWRVYRHRSACPLQLPTVIKNTIKEAVEAHYEYVGRYPEGFK